MLIPPRSLLQVHNRNLLSLDFDRVTRTEKIYDDHRKFTLRILYDQAGRPSLWSPSSRLNGVNVTYSAGGHIAGIQRGTMSERMEYDQSGRITSRIFADGKAWSYTYLEKVRQDLCRGSLQVLSIFLKAQNHGVGIWPIRPSSTTPCSMQKNLH